MVEFSKIIRKVKKPDQPAESRSPQTQSDHLPDQRNVAERAFVRQPEGEKKPEMYLPDESSQSRSCEAPPEITIAPVKSLFVSRQGGGGSVSSRPSEHPMISTANGHSLPQGPVADGTAKDGAHQSQPEMDSVYIYDQLFACAREIYAKGFDWKAYDLSRTRLLILDVVNAILAGEQKLLQRAVSFIRSQEDLYVRQHAVNVCILSVTIGAQMDLPRPQLLDLGLTGFLHDVGLVDFEEIIAQPRKLTPTEFDAIKKHVERGDQLLRQMQPAIPELILSAHFEVHERLDGSGYPHGKRDISDFAKILGLADTFESMVHPRAFRPRYSVMDVYRRIFDVKKQFDQVFIKALMDSVGFFPNGMTIQLNTKEKGVVVRQNAGAPMRPVARIHHDAAGEPIPDREQKEIDLAMFPTIHVTKCYLEEDIILEQPA